MSDWILQFNRFAEAWSAAMWRACWQGAIAICVVWAVVRLLSSISPRLRCWFWRLAYFKIAVALLWAYPLELPLLSSPVDDPGVSRATSDAATSTAQRNGPRTSSPEPSKAKDTSTGISLLPGASYLFVLWLAGVAWYVRRLVRDWRWIRRLRANAWNVTNGTILDAYELACERFAVRSPPDLLEVDGDDGPLLVGPWRPAILLPSSIRHLRSEEQRLLLSHELSHFVRRDLLWNWLAFLVEATLFFHPLVWVAKRRWLLAQETACDELVVQQPDVRAADYGRLLLKVATGRDANARPAVATLGVVDSSDTLKERLTSMKYVTPPSTKQLALVAALTASIAIVGIVPWQIVAQEVAPKKRGLVFEKVIELTINDDDPRYGNFLADLDKGKVFSPPKDFRPRNRKEMTTWLEKRGVDLFGESFGLLGMDMVAMPTSERSWDPSPRNFSQVDSGRPGRPIPITGHGELPATYFFKTREGRRGILQILEFNEKAEGKPFSTKIRYKLEAKSR